MKELLEKAINGDSMALKDIYTKYSKSVYYFCLKVMPTAEDAAEMCAETFDCAFARLDTLENPDQFDIWIKNIAAIRCYNSIHKMKPMLFLQAVADTEQCLFSEAELEEMPQGELEETRTCQLMDSMLDRLNDAQRMTLMFHYYNGLSVVQIAKVMSCTAEIVKQRMEKAAEHMRNTIVALSERGIKLKQVDFRTSLGLMAACQSVPQIVDAQVAGIILSIAGVEEPEEEQVAPTPAATQYNFESFAASCGSSSVDGEPKQEEPAEQDPDLKIVTPRVPRKRSGENGFLKKLKGLTSMQQSVALVVVVAIIAAIIIGVGIGNKKENPDLAQSSSAAVSVASKTSSAEITVPKYEVTFAEEKQEVKASDGKVVARASYQVPTAELSDGTVAALKINEIIEEEKKEVLETYSDDAVQLECIYGYENAPHGPWQLNETKVEMKGGKINSRVVNLVKTTTEFKYGNVVSQTEVEGYCFSVADGKRLSISDIMEDEDAYLNYAANKIREHFEEKQNAGEYQLYSDYSTTVSDVLEQEGRWYLTDEGITVIFNPDEVVYITLGVQTVDLPMAEIKDYLKTEYKK